MVSSFPHRVNMPSCSDQEKNGTAQLYQNRQFYHMFHPKGMAVISKIATQPYQSIGVGCLLSDQSIKRDCRIEIQKINQPAKPDACKVFLVHSLHLLNIADSKQVRIQYHLLPEEEAAQQNPAAQDAEEEQE